MRLLGGRYRLVEPVGRGGMAVVWRAEDELLHRTVAVKLLAPQLASDRRSRELIRAEASAAAQLNHPHIANVYDYGEARLHGYRRVPYLVMEFVHGETLAARLHGGGAMDWRDAVRVCADVAAALTAAHAADLVHRDVKPGNVLLAPAGVKLVDLGIALGVGQRSVGEHGEVLGTPRYMAPEQARGDAAVPASDVYALGLLLHECLVGVPLRQGDSVVELLAPGHAAPVAGVPGLPEAVGGLCGRCLAPDPADRPTSAQVWKLLSEVVGTRPAIPVGPAAGLDAASGPVPATRPAVPSGRIPRSGAVRATRPASSGRLPRRRGAARRGLLLAAVPSTALAAVLAAQLPGLTSTDDAAEGAGAGSDASSSGCTARYTSHRASDGTFTADLTVTHAGAARSENRTLSFALPAGQRLTGGTEGVHLLRRVRNVTVRVDGPAGPDGTTTVGLWGTYDDSTRGEPTGFAVNGVPCRRASTSITSTTVATPSVRPSRTTPGAGGGQDEETTASARPTDPTAGGSSTPASPDRTPTTGPPTGAPTSPGVPGVSPRPTTGAPSPTQSPSPAQSPSPPDAPGPVESTQPDTPATPTASTGESPAGTAQPSTDPSPGDGG
ncbi:serine/threonine-protein kinase [Micromonospora halophytica]|uniref:non-specific serine/threonine protein kinase n=1 Tax=Micromonospora halophytica TaxID=47864 RepID=A0A1C5I732_9ACTN|nr:serine/threonine-protein kinase [Micromonospora halophytica]SCG54128.1 serine/threonine protein kinase [Micromonospora halophytica]